MGEFTTHTKEDLNALNKDDVISIALSQQEQLNAMSEQLNFITEQLILMNHHTFGRKTEKLDQMDQITMYDYFNEIEAKSDDSKEPEITEIDISTHTRRKKSKRGDKLEGLPARIFEHTLSIRRGTY